MGARAGEITQLRGEGLVKRDGHWAIQITPDACTAKTGEARTVPVHEDLISHPIKFISEVPRALPASAV
jgi:integrase